jgi:hypothetical protein
MTRFLTLGGAHRSSRANGPGNQRDHDPEAQRENQDRTHHRTCCNAALPANLPRLFV